MRIMRTGSGTPLVLIHGWASSGRVFDAAVADLERDHRCHVLDLPGHGAAVADRWDVGVDDLVAAVAEDVAGFEEPPRIVGWAMGAMIGLEVATRVPVRSLVCVGTASGGPDVADGFTKMAELMARDWPRFARSSVDTIVGDRVSTEMHAHLTRIMTDTPLVVARRTILDVAERDVRETAAEVDRPVLYVHGSQDRISPLPVGEGIAAATTRGELIVYDGAGHAPHLEDPTRFATDIRTFWEGHDDA